MARARGLLVGVRYVDRNTYGDDHRNGCFGSELDVDNVDRIVRPLGYDCTTLKTEQASAAAILDGIAAAGTASQPGDLFLFYFSGHGGQHPDSNGDEADGEDETLFAFDRPILDDELDERWRSFSPGVRVLMISDSCNSGTNYKFTPALMRRAVEPSTVSLMSPSAAPEMRATMLHMGAARDGEDAKGYLGGGAFTIAMCDVWQLGAFTGTYRTLFTRINERVGEQFPEFHKYGPDGDAFSLQRPFRL